MGDPVKSSFMVKCNFFIFTFICVKPVKDARHRESSEVHLVAPCKTELLHIFHEFMFAVL